MDVRREESKRFLEQHEETFGVSDLKFTQEERVALAASSDPGAVRMAVLLDRLDQCVGVNTYYHRSNYTRNHRSR